MLHFVITSNDIRLRRLQPPLQIPEHVEPANIWDIVTCMAQACISWLERMPGVRVNRKYVTTAGVSMGGAIAAALATRYNVFRTGMVLHSPCAPPSAITRAAVSACPRKALSTTHNLPFHRHKLLHSTCTWDARS